MPTATDDQHDERHETPQDVLAEMAKARRKRRLGDKTPFDLLYQAYLTGLATIIGVVVASGFIPEVPVRDVARLVPVLPPIVGLVIALALLFALRSGSRGGPLVLDAASVHYVLMAPIEPTLVLRPEALSRLRKSEYTGALVGAGAGMLAAQRLPGSKLAYVLPGLGIGVVVGALQAGVALIASGRRIKPMVASAVGLVIVGASAFDVWQASAFSPLTHLGRLGLWRLDASPTSFAALALVPVVVMLGLSGVAGTSVEMARNRASLVSQMHFATARQDLRAVILVRRQLAQEQSRARPWIKIRRGKGRWPVLRRDLHGLLRFPAVRLFRMLCLGALGGLCLLGVWDRTWVLIVPAALCLYVAALDAVEPIGQELDHELRWQSYPIDTGRLLAQHLAGPTLAMLPVVIVGGLTAAGVTSLRGGDAALALRMLVTVAPVVCFGSVVAAGIATCLGPADPFRNAQMLASPEVVGGYFIWRVALPPALVALSLAPVASARSALSRGLAPLPAASNLCLTVSFVLIAATMWLTRRQPTPV